MRAPTTDSATGRALKTAVQAIVGAAVGLIVTIWAVPGVPEAVIHYAQENVLPILLTVGVPSGLASLIYNIFFRKSVQNY